MKTNLFTFLIVSIALFVFNTNIFSQATGDYVATTGGDYNTAANWSISNGSGGYSGVASSAPTTANNVWIPVGISMTSSAATNALNLDVAGTFTVGNYQLTINGNLTVESTGVLTSVNSNGGTVADLKIGSSLASGPCLIQIDGQFGSINGSTGAGSGFRTGIDAGGTTTIQGSGKVNITGLRPYSNNARTQNIVINMDVNIMNSVNNMPTLTLVNGTAATATKTLVINTGKTVTFINDADATLGGSTNGTAVQSSTGGDILYDIEGTLNTGTLGGLWLTTTSSTGNTQSTNQKITLRVGPSGVLKLGARILTAVGQPATQSIVYDFQTGSTVVYQGTTAPTFTGFTGFNQSYMSSFSNMTMNNSGGLVLPVATTVNNTLLLSSGTISLGTKNLTIAAGGSISGGSATNYIVTDGTGVLNQSVPASTAVTFPIGASTTSYDPVTVTPTTGTATSVKVSAVLSGTPASGVSYNPKEWTVTPTTSSSTILAFKPSAEDATVASMIAVSPYYSLIGQALGNGSYTNVNTTSYSSGIYTGSFNTFGSFVTGINSNATENVNAATGSLKVYSNRNGLVVSGALTNDLVMVYGVNGQMVAKVNANGNQTVLNLNSGVYIVKVTSVSTTKTAKVVVD